MKDNEFTEIFGKDPDTQATAIKTEINSNESSRNYVVADAEPDEDCSPDSIEVGPDEIEQKFDEFKKLIQKCPTGSPTLTDNWLVELKSFYTDFAVMLGQDGSIETSPDA